MEFKLIYLALAGVAAGFLNVNAGGGSLITMPLLMLFRLPADVAIGTNKIALLLQNGISTLRFRKSGYFDWKPALLLSIPAVIGATLGSMAAVRIPDDIFRKIIAAVMFMSIVLILSKNRGRTGGEKVSVRVTAALMAGFFFIGLYGGFIQAGVGFIIIAVLSTVPGMSLVQINGLKIIIVFIYTIPSLSVFIGSGKINLVYGLVLAAGNGLGGWLGTVFAVRKGDKWIKVVLLTAVFLMAWKLLGLPPFK